MSNLSFSSIATGHVRLNPLQHLALSLGEVETEYQEFAGDVKLGNAYASYLENTYPSLRSFTLNIPVLRYYFKGNGDIDLLNEKSTNIAWVEWMYNIHKLDRHFLFSHPIYGDVKVRFAESFKVPKGKAGGQACVEGLELKLIEIPSSNLLINFTPRTLTEHDFNFPYHLIQTDYQEEGTTAILGGNYTYAVRGAKPEQRIFTLYFRGLKYNENIMGDIDTSVDPELNMGLLEQFYTQFKLWKPFYYLHPVYGRLRVRFNKSLKIPKIIPNSTGWVSDFQLELIEEVEDAKRYY